MTTTIQRFNVHNFTIEEVQAVDKTMQILTDLQNFYDDSVILANANDGEFICIEELARVKGILSFLYMNRVVEVNPRLFCPGAKKKVLDKSPKLWYNKGTKEGSKAGAKGETHESRVSP